MAASTSTASNDEVETFQLQLSSGNGPVYRTVLRTALRDATPDEIPIIDVSGIFSTSFEDRLAVARQIHNAATNNGFFYIKNHGIPSTVTGPAHQACLDFFRQDIDTKQKADATKSAYYNGYKAPKTQRINPSEGVDNRETFSWTYDPRCDPAVRDLSSIPEDIRRHIRLEPDGPESSEDGRFPWCETRSVPHFKTSVVRYWRSCLALARQLVSIGSHTDFQLFTMLWQDSNGGLQVLNRQGQWINAKPIEGTFVVNIADYLQRITNDKYISTVHRAVNNSGKERISMPFFFGFNSNESCGVLDSCVGADGVRKYEEISCQDWVKRRVKAMHDTKPGEAEGTK
ncbi:hypothetical protein VP1G_00268 [Cytospora mali]|uniref:Fe2OG dioxygenase domain-containing protein n=1 Tax=Cytospora mali TaxID=578113 RepID=A0A194UM72_CYTMA|nr:hypothetical protein VP1G_00268 [Valsa mali var. pyri (nom. inval.)]